MISRPSFSVFLVALTFPVVLAQKRKLLCTDEICSVSNNPLFKGTGWQPNGKFCVDNDPFDRVTLGHISWSFLHTTAAYLPERLDNVSATAFRNLIWVVRDIYACQLCRGHFQELMKDPILIRELNEVESRMDAVLFVWKVHNMVTTLQHPNAPLFFGADVSQRFMPLPMNQSFTLHDGQRVYASNSTGNLMTDYFHPDFTPGKTELRIEDLVQSFKYQIYDGVMHRWRAAGGLVPIPSIYAPGVEPETAKKWFKGNLAQIKTYPLSTPLTCQPSIAAIRSLPHSEQIKVCPRPIPAGKIEVLIITMSRCPFCGLTVESLKPILQGALGERINLVDRYVLQQTRIPARSLSDFSSLHGPGEVLGDALELCAQRLYPELWLDLIWCMDHKWYAVGAKNWTEECASGLGMDYDKLHQCAWSADAVRMLEASVALDAQYNVTGAPTIVINGVKVSVGVKFPSELEQLFCDALACQELSPQLYPASKMATEATSSAEYLQDMTSYGDAHDQFGEPTAMYSDTHQRVYQKLLQGMLQDGQVTQAERTMLADMRLELGITRTDHELHVAKDSFVVPLLETHHSTDLTGQAILTGAGVVGLLVLAVAGMARIARRTIQYDIVPVEDLPLSEPEQA